MYKALFLDRDGVINIDKGYVFELSDFEFVKGIECLIKRAKVLNYKVICITNQSGIARGFFSEDNFHDFMNQINRELKLSIGYELDSYYYCPHHPKGRVKKYSFICNCRKPATGLFDMACNDFHLDLKNSIFIGDKLSDLKAASLVNINKLYLYSKSIFNPHSEKYIIINDLKEIKL